MSFRFAKTVTSRKRSFSIRRLCICLVPGTLVSRIPDSDQLVVKCDNDDKCEVIAWEQIYVIVSNQ